MNATAGFPPRLEDMMDAATREGFYEEAYRMQEKRWAGAWRERCALHKRVKELTAECEEWRWFARMLGTMTSTEKHKSTDTLHGTVAVNGSLVRHDLRAIDFACADLAKKMRRDVAPLPETPRTP